MVNRTDFDVDRLPAASVATKRAWYLPSLNLRLPTQPLNRLVLRPATPCWLKATQPGAADAGTRAGGSLGFGFGSVPRPCGRPTDE